MSIETRIRKIEKAIEGVEFPGAEFPKILEWIRSRNYPSMRTGKPLEGEDLERFAQSYHEEHKTLERVKEVLLAWEAERDKWHEIWSEAIDREYVRLGKPRPPKPPEGLSLKESIDWIMAHD
jgi:hypothetical protein